MSTAKKSHSGFISLATIATLAVVAVVSIVTAVSVGNVRKSQETRSDASVGSCSELTTANSCNGVNGCSWKDQEMGSCVATYGANKGACQSKAGCSWDSVQCSLSFCPDGCNRVEREVKVVTCSLSNCDKNRCNYLSEIRAPGSCMSIEGRAGCSGKSEGVCPGSKDSAGMSCFWSPGRIIRSESCTGSYVEVIREASCDGEINGICKGQYVKESAKCVGTPTPQYTCESKGGSCFSGSSCSSESINRTSVDGTCQSGKVCCGDKFVNKCGKGTSYCENGKLHTCRANLSGYDESSCGTGKTCPDGKSACEKEPLTDKCTTPYADCSAPNQTVSCTTNSGQTGTKKCTMTQCTGGSSPTCTNGAKDCTACVAVATPTPNPTPKVTPTPTPTPVNKCDKGPSYCGSNGKLYTCTSPSAGYKQTSCGANETCKSGDTFCSPKEITVNNCTQGERYCFTDGVLRICKDDKSGYTSQSCKSGEKCNSTTKKCEVVATPTPIPTPKPASLTPPSCSDAGGACLFGYSSCSVAGSNRTSVNGTCSGNAICCSKEQIVNKCDKGTSYCDTDKQFINTCTVDKSGYVRTKCAFGSLCNSNTNKCEAVNNNCKQGLVHCGDDGQLYTCKKDYSGYSASSCGSGKTCPQGKSACEVSSEAPRGVTCYDECRAQGNSPTECQAYPACAPTTTPINSCTGFNEGDTCNVDGFKRGYCTKSGSTLVCSLAKDNGSSCSNNKECSSNLCLNNVCRPAGLTQGQACLDNTQCLTKNCTQASSGPKTCQVAGYTPGMQKVGEGSSCGTNSFGTFVCKEGLECKSGVCRKEVVTKLQGGASCTSDSQCLSGTCTLSGTCFDDGGLAEARAGNSRVTAVSDPLVNAEVINMAVALCEGEGNSAQTCQKAIAELSDSNQLDCVNMRLATGKTLDYAVDQCAKELKATMIMAAGVYGAVAAPVVVPAVAGAGAQAYAIATGVYNSVALTLISGGASPLVQRGYDILSSGWNYYFQYRNYIKNISSATCVVNQIVGQDFSCGAAMVEARVVPKPKLLNQGMQIYKEITKLADGTTYNNISSGAKSVYNLLDPVLPVGDDVVMENPDYLDFSDSDPELTYSQIAMLNFIPDYLTAADQGRDLYAELWEENDVMLAQLPIGVRSSFDKSENQQNTKDPGGSTLSLNQYMASPSGEGGGLLLSNLGQFGNLSQDFLSDNLQAGGIPLILVGNSVVSRQSVNLINTIPDMSQASATTMNSEIYRYFDPKLVSGSTLIPN